MQGKEIFEKGEKGDSELVISWQASLIEKKIGYAWQVCFDYTFPKDTPLENTREPIHWLYMDGQETLPEEGFSFTKSNAKKAALRRIQIELEVNKLS